MTAPSLLTRVRRALTGEAMVPRGTLVLAAVSGGPDSMVMLDALARLAPRLGLTVAAHGVDHGLRPAAGGELDQAEAWAARAGVPFASTRVTLAPGGNVQARARAARYAALSAAARQLGAGALTTAHHADDRAETVLLRLLRGAGPRGLAVLAPRLVLPGDLGGDGSLLLVRPLLRARRADVLRHAARHEVPFCRDPSNHDERYLRARVRAELLPLLDALGPGIVGHLNDLADRLAALEAPPLGLPRATQDALAALLRTRSTSAQVWLPGGLVVSSCQRSAPAKRGKTRDPASPGPPRAPPDSSAMPKGCREGEGGPGCGIPVSK
jgi:tRNA(Ile)-lysidine synthase